MNPAYTSSAQDSFVVVVRTDEGLYGIGESDVNPWIAKACVEAPGTHTMSLCLRDLLVGQDPMDIEGLWRRAYLGTAMHGRRGALIHALGAVEMALWDLKGKALGKPVWALLGGAGRDAVVPYASLQPNGHSFEAYRDSLVAWAARARELGFKAVKAEVTMNGPYAHAGLHEAYDRHTEVVAAVRKALGPSIALMVDVQYMWSDAETALRTVRDWAAFDLFFLETPVWVDNLDDYARLHEEAPMRIACGEWQATRHEFAELMDRGRVDVAQPDVGRVGGLMEAKAVCDMAAARGRLIVPHCWKTGISIAATAHLAFVTPHCPFIEFLPPSLCEDVLRRELVAEELAFENGTIRRPAKPGLGIELNWDAVKRFAA
jgi:L-alanine-DL-glutamate epimerase-like enolase superfamily enzyme